MCNMSVSQRITARSAGEVIEVVEAIVNSFRVRHLSQRPSVVPENVAWAIATKKFGSAYFATTDVSDTYKQHVAMYWYVWRRVLYADIRVWCSVGSTENVRARVFQAEAFGASKWFVLACVLPNVHAMYTDSVSRYKSRSLKRLGFDVDPNWVISDFFVQDLSCGCHVAVVFSSAGVTHVIGRVYIVRRDGCARLIGTLHKDEFSWSGVTRSIQRIYGMDEIEFVHSVGHYPHDQNP